MNLQDWWNVVFLLIVVPLLLIYLHKKGWW